MDEIRSVPLRSLAHTAALGLLSNASGCQEQDLPHFGTLIYESDAFEVWASADMEACGGTFDYVEGWLVGFRDHVGEHARPAKHAFYWLSPEEYDRDLCPTGIACAYSRANVIYSTIIPYEHEIVHTELDARPPSILLEGAAEVFGSIDSPFTTEVADLDLLLDADQITGYGYPTAGRFSRFIIERHGLDSYFELYEALDGAQGRDAIAAGTLDILGVDLTTLVSDFEQSSPCSVDRWRYFDRECSALPLTPWQSTDRWSEEIDLSCAAPCYRSRQLMAFRSRQLMPITFANVGAAHDREDDGHPRGERAHRTRSRRRWPSQSCVGHKGRSSPAASAAR